MAWYSVLAADSLVVGSFLHQGCGNAPSNLMDGKHDGVHTTFLRKISLTYYTHIWVQ